MPEALSRIVQAEEVSLAAAPGGKRVAVFCSSASNLDVKYQRAAQQLGELLGQWGCALIYGGGSWGLMGEVARSAHKQGVSILGVVPTFMVSTFGDCYGEVVVVDGMASRKALIDQHADVFLALPGGFGTLDEITEMLTWNQIGMNNKLIGLLNTDGFYSEIWAWVQKSVKQGFINPSHVENLIMADTPEELIHQLMTRVPEAVPGKFRIKA